MTRALLLFVAFVAFVGCLMAPRWARAQDAPPEIEVAVSTDQAEVGDPFNVQLSAMSSDVDEMASDPDLHPPAVFTMMGPQVSPQRVHLNINGRVSQKSGIVVTWQLTPTKEGHYVIPGPTVVWKGKKLASKPIPIDIVPSAGRGRRGRGGQSPFLLPGGPTFRFGTGGFTFRWPSQSSMGFDDLDDILDDPALALDAAPDANMFVRAIADKTKAVLGEQITVSFYLYQREMYEVAERREAPMTDFMRVPLVADPGTIQPKLARVGDRKYRVRLMDRVALFPLRTGDLHTGSMRVGVAHRGRGPRLFRESEDVVIHVTEPPLAGRPAGYVLGDVGQFSLSASVAPRRIDQGGTLAVTLKVSGRGNLPRSLKVPARTGVEWFDPEKRDAIEPEGDAVQGYRTFGYVVRIDDSGTIDLGKVELSYWNPAANQYQVATATLGTVEVRSVAPKDDATPADQTAALRSDPFAAMPSARTVLRPFAARLSAPTENGAFWLLVAAPPLLVAMHGAGKRVLEDRRRQRAAREESAETRIARDLRRAEEASAQKDTQAFAAALERAVIHAIEGACGLKARGVLVSDLARELEERGVPVELGSRVQATLAAWEAIRFDPTTSADAMATLDDQARGIVRDLHDIGKRTSHPSGAAPGRSSR